MNNKLKYKTFEKSDYDAVLDMGRKLWSDYGDAEFRDQFDQICSADNARIEVALDSTEKAIGFAMFTIRSDYVEGAEKTPTGYLEGIYVEPEFRKLGVAKRFVQIGEEWLKENGCTQIGSDTWLTARESRAFHKSIGFWEEDELVHFLKDID